MLLRSFKERIQETEEAHGLLNNHLQTTVQVKNLTDWLKRIPDARDAIVWYYLH